MPVCVRHSEVVVSSRSVPSTHIFTDVPTARTRTIPDHGPPDADDATKLFDVGPTLL